MAVPADIKILVNALGSMLDHYLLCRMVFLNYDASTRQLSAEAKHQRNVYRGRWQRSRSRYSANTSRVYAGQRATSSYKRPSWIPSTLDREEGTENRGKPRAVPQKEKNLSSSRRRQLEEARLFLTPAISDYNPFRLHRQEDHYQALKQIHHSYLLAITYNWTRLVPIETKPGIFPLVRTFLEFANQNDAFYFCSLYTSTIHASVLQHGPDGLNRLSALSLELKGKALQCLQQDINATGSSMPSDIVINVIAALAAQEPDQNALTLRRGHHQRQSPLVKAQLLDVIAYMKPEIAHVMAMYQLVERRGGIQNIKTFGVAYLVALVDLLAANSQALPPRLPMSWKYRSPFLCIERDAHACDVHTSSPLGKGFFTISPGLKAQIEPFFYLLPYISEVSAAIAGYQCRTSHDVSPAWDLNLGDIVKFANSVHYRILCLGQPESPEAPQEENVSLDIIRLAALLHSNFVIFPVGHPSGVPNILAHKLQSILQERDDTNPFVCDSELELWMLTWGAIGALQEAILLRWFVGRIGKLTRELCNNNWPKYLEILQGFLWWSYICDDYARQIWACLEHSPE